ncbi:glycosyltransferase [Rhodobacterales bacterium HKCCSP123]|nr:glycosyltransferase [Rhodobacterales bacterium HKCCSP123]
MFFRLFALYLRYVAQHADRLGGFSLPRDRQGRLGHVEEIKRANGSTRIVGWTSARELRLSWPGGETRVEPTIQRADVTLRFGLPLVSGFEIEAPEGVRPLWLHVPTFDGTVLDLPVPHPADPPTPKALRRLRRAFVLDLLRALPACLSWLATRDPAARTRIKHAFGLEAVATGLPLDPRYFAPGSVARSYHPVTVVLPVHNAFDLLGQTLRRFEAHTDCDWHLVLVEDASSDIRVRPFLRTWAEERPGQVTLIELQENRGFVGAVNRGLEQAEGRPGHVIVLNSDVMLPAGWASRLVAPFDLDPWIASVTPMSNDAEIFSVPNICEAMPLADGLVDRIDAVARSLSLPDRLPSAPTGVGFCMAMNAHWFHREPRFDSAFGRGYGEEVDWCQKTRRMGARHVGLPSLFVEHRGGQSFGREAKAGLVVKANALIARRYPTYDLEVQAYIGRDPLRTPRLALAVAIAGEMSLDALPLYLAHSMGGGADHALDAEIAARTAQGQYALVLRVGGPWRWQLEVHGPGGTLSGVTGELEHVRRMLEPVPALRIVYSCGVGDPDPVSLPDALLSFVRAGRPTRLEARLHDYFVISPSYCLLNSDGSYRGPVGPDNPDPAHAARRPQGGVASLREWQTAWGQFLSRCDEITVFSESSRWQLLETYPGLRGRVAYRPHAMIERIPRVHAPGHGASASGTVAVLGNVNLQKGAGVLTALAEEIARRGSGPRLVLIGNIDAAFSLPPSVRLHGSYTRSDIAHLAERYGVTAWLVPSVWPETFSFVTHEALATGLPVFGFDIGAQGEALRRAPNGAPIPFHPDGDHAAAILAAFGRQFEGRADPAAPVLRGLDEAAE